MRISKNNHKAAQPKNSPGSPITLWLFERDRSRQRQSFSVAACDTAGYSGGMVLFSDCWGGNRSKEVQNRSGAWLIRDPFDWHISSGRRERVGAISRTHRYGALLQHSYKPNKTNKTKFLWRESTLNNLPSLSASPMYTGSTRLMVFTRSFLRNLISTVPSGSSTPPLQNTHTYESAQSGHDNESVWSPASERLAKLKNLSADADT